MMKKGLAAVIVLMSLVLVYGFADASVTGGCSNCHTMHNSQNGAPVARDGSGVGWGDAGKLVGGNPDATPNGNLLATTCVGCHTSTTAQTIVSLGSSKIPIVFNTVAPTNPLAGGNFFWVSTGGATNDVYGHNVYGISGIDHNITETIGAPGRNGGPGSVSGCSCHYTLARDGSENAYKKNGCQGCHFKVAHHDDTKPWYRYLVGHMSDDYHVTGIEDSNWEQNPTSTVHNKYKGVTTPYAWGSALNTTNSISAFCSGCHYQFHDEMGFGPWLRHPTDIALPTTGEYGGYDPTANYSPQAPVAWTNPSSPTRATAVVMCLSCHRAHGSPEPDLLRWTYSGMVANTTGTTAGTGCFTCHTTKDGV